ncbi:MAG: hypothetical protein HPZ91_16230 [Lentisphaeria bacterium]|nr:hypothetical protein [Lentisphaeria bacterium]
MRKILLVLLWSAAALAAAQDNFNRDRLGVWWCWAGSAEARPSVKLDGDAAEGSGALRLDFRPVRGTALVGGNAKIPAGADAVSLWLKPLSGKPVGFVLLETDPKMTGTIDRYLAPLAFPEEGCYRRQVIGFGEFKYAKPGRDAEPKKLDPATVHTISFTVYNAAAPFSYLVDDIRFIRRERKGTPAASPGNLLRGDTGFETGAGDWLLLRPVPGHETLTVDETVAASGSASVKLRPGDSSFSGGCDVVLEPGQPYTLSFFVRSAEPDQLACRIATRFWKTVAWKRVETGMEWQRCVVSVPPQSERETVRIVFGQIARRGDVWIDAVMLEKGTAVSAYRPAEPFSLAAATGEPGEVVVEGKAPVEARFRLYNSAISLERQPFSLSVEVCGPAGKVLGRFSEEFRLEPGESAAFSRQLLPAAVRGYYPVRAVVRDRSGAPVVEAELPFAVVPSVRPELDAESFFGIHPGQMPLEALRRIGAKWIRFGVEWRMVEPERGSFRAVNKRDFRKEGFYDICTLGAVPAWAGEGGAFPARPEEMAGFLGRVLAESAGSVGCYELENEPDLRRGMTAENYAAWLSAVAPQIRASGKPLLFGDSGSGSAFAERVFALAAGSFDVYAPHPYTSPRYFGPEAGHVIGPEEGNLAGRLRHASELIRKYGGKQELWIGELGWAADRREPVAGDIARRHADTLARAFLIARNHPQLKRLAWFTAQGTIEGNHYEYGLWAGRNGLKPRPAVAAYATLASLLDRAEPLAPISDGEIKAYVFRRGGEAVVAVWDSAGGGEEPPELALPAGSVAVRALDGGELSGPAVRITSSPVFLTVSTGALPELSGRIRAAIASRRPVRLALGVSALDAVQVTLGGNLNTSLEGELAVVWPGGGRSVRPFSLAPGGIGVLAFTPVPPLPLSGGELRFELTAVGSAKPVVIRKALPPFTACPPARQSTPMFRLDRREQVLPADPAVGWNSPADLCATGGIWYDRQNFYFELDVADPVFHQPFSGAAMWRGDSVQFAFDCLGDGTAAGYDHNDHEFLAALVDGRPELRRVHAPAGMVAGPVAGVETQIFPVPGGLRYRFAVPWAELAPLRPEPGRVFGFNFIVNNSSGFGRGYWIGLTPGIGERKNPALFRKFVIQSSKEAGK